MPANFIDDKKISEKEKKKTVGRFKRRIVTRYRVIIIRINVVRNHGT